MCENDVEQFSLCGEAKLLLGILVSPHVRFFALICAGREFADDWIDPLQMGLEKAELLVVDYCWTLIAIRLVGC